MRSIVVIKKCETVKIYVDSKEIKYKDKYCILIGNIYNIDELYNVTNNLSIEQKLLELYDKYQEKLFYKLSGEYAVIFIKDNDITLVRDRMGSKHLYYGIVNNQFICSNNLEYFINTYKQLLEIDKQQLANYLSYCYINEPYTIFKNIYKLKAGNYLFYDNKIEEKKYYNLIEEYKKTHNKLKNFKAAKNNVENNLKNAIKIRTNNKQKVGVLLSAGIDSTLIATFAKKNNMEVHTYTIGFYENERNEALKAKKIADYLNTIHHEKYLEHEIAKQIVYEIPKIYSEPLGDPSIIPLLFLYKNVDKDIDIVLTGDGADQLFCGNGAYDHFNRIKLLPKYIYNLIVSIFFTTKQKKRIPISYNYKKYGTQNFFDIVSKSYYNFPPLKFKRQIKYMLFDIKTFLTNRLFSKVSFSAMYHGINISHPFVDNDLVATSLQLKYKYKYHKKQKKYILKQILYENIPEGLLNTKKNGFGIPLKKWIYNIYKEDIIRLSNSKILERQGLFPVSKIAQEIDKLKNETLMQEECTIMFSYYMFQLWYQYYIEDLWKEKEDD